MWAFIRRWGGHSQEDLRDAVATCLLEHLLEYHFEIYFPQVEALALADSLFGDTFLRCWQFGQAEEADNAARFEALKTRLEAVEPTEPASDLRMRAGLEQRGKSQGHGGKTDI